MAKSFLKWAGGKTGYARLLESLSPPKWSGKFVEPFMGSAALFFQVEPDRAVLADSNEELVICFQEVRDHPHEVMGLLDEIPNEKEHYEMVRSTDPATLQPLHRAARVIYLNKTGFRGLWRVNRQGRFNVPYGAYERPYYNRDAFLMASKVLQGAKLRCGDYRECLRSARKGDWVYLDPPYVPTGAWGDFTRYTAGQFSGSDHEGLATQVRSLDARGVHFLLTNSDTPFARDLYSGFGMGILETRRDIDLRSRHRKSTDLVVSNYLGSAEIKNSIARAS